MPEKIKGAAYVLLSGGIDSTTCLAYATHTFERVVALTVDYKQRHQREMQSAQEIVKYFRDQGHDIEQKMLQMPLGVGGLTNPDQVIPQIGYDEIHGVSPSYVPFRNGSLLSLAASQAQADPQGVAVMYGAHAEDAANWAYPDCTPEFIGAMSAAIYIGTYHRVRLYTPLMWMAKSDVVVMGYKYQAPLHLTWSCYEGGEKHCGVCPTCRARKQAFNQAGHLDLTEYLA